MVMEGTEHISHHYPHPGLGLSLMDSLTRVDHMEHDLSGDLRSVQAIILDRTSLACSSFLRRSL